MRSLQQCLRYMRGRLTLEKVNAAINDMVSYAEANALLIVVPKKKLAENLWEKALEIRDIASMEGIKGKHSFLEADIKGPSLKLDNTGKAILIIFEPPSTKNESLNSQQSAHASHTLSYAHRMLGSLLFYLCHERST
ncbi:hypothetical protein GLYMA_03G031466v4 [Glycine max]|nr:hypothetical protein GYH30_006126 [Glycine max]KRH65373.2 hypothetical protein GLYMA_03G031466v4 [Glycine max]